jgi:predicted RNA-binding Zn-ribbon protein involved in translation (DUF1610 family)
MRRTAPIHREPCTRIGRSHEYVIQITVILTVNAYGKGVQSNSPAMPKSCPICGHNSIQRATKRGVLNLYRCVGGHYFIFDFDPTAKDQKAGK